MSDPHSPLDGVPRSAQAEERLDDLVERALSTQAGQELLAYLKSITINQVLGSEVSDQRLRAHEGARGLVALLQTRMQRADARRRQQAKAKE